MLVHQSQMYAPGLARHPPVAHDTLHIDRADLMRLPCLVSAFAVEHGLVLAQRATGAERGELTVLPSLLDGLELRGCLVSLDALACRPEIAEQIADVAATICWPSRAIRTR